jgi:PAS domain S-box-containing protein
MASEAHERMLESVRLSPVAFVVTNPRLPDNPIEVANDAFYSLTGYSEREVLGRNCRFLAGEGTENWVTAQIRTAIRAKRPLLIDILNYRKNGSPFRNGVMITPLFDEDGKVSFFLGSQADLGLDAERPLAPAQAKAAALVDALAPRQREVLAGMASGLLNKQIAYRLGITEKTVKMHRALMLDRLGVRTTAEAIRIAVEAGL